MPCLCCVTSLPHSLIFTTSLRLGNALWHSEWQWTGKDFKAVRSSWCDVHVGVCITLRSLLVRYLLLEKRLCSCTLCLIDHVIQSLTQVNVRIGACQWGNIPKRWRASEEQESAEITSTDVLGSPTWPFLKVLAEGSPASSPHTIPSLSWARAFRSRCTTLLQRSQ